MTIRNGVLYHHEGKFRVKEGIRFVKSAKGSFGKFLHVHIIREDGKTRCGRMIPDTWEEITLDIQGYYDETFHCGDCMHKFDVLEKISELGGKQE